MPRLTENSKPSNLKSFCSWLKFCSLLVSSGHLDRHWCDLAEESFFCRRGKRCSSRRWALCKFTGSKFLPFCDFLTVVCLVLIFFFFTIVIFWFFFLRFSFYLPLEGSDGVQCAWRYMPTVCIESQCCCLLYIGSLIHNSKELWHKTVASLFWMSVDIKVELFNLLVEFLCAHNCNFRLF